MTQTNGSFKLPSVGRVSFLVNPTYIPEDTSSRPEKRSSIADEKLQKLSTNGSLVASNRHKEERSRRKNTEKRKSGYQSLPPPKRQTEVEDSRQVSSAPTDKQADKPAARALPKLNTLVKGKYEIQYDRTLRTKQPTQASTKPSNQPKTSSSKHIADPELGTAWATSRAKDQPASQIPASKELRNAAAVSQASGTINKKMPSYSRSDNDRTAEKSSSPTKTKSTTESTPPTKSATQSKSDDKLQQDLKQSPAQSSSKNGASVIVNGDQPKLDSKKRTSFLLSANTQKEYDGKSNGNNTNVQKKSSVTKRSNTFNYNPKPRASTPRSKESDHNNNNVNKSNINKNRSRTFSEMPSNHRSNTKASLQSRVAPYDSLSLSGENPYTSEIQNVIDKLKKKVSENKNNKSKNVDEKTKNIPPWHRKEYILSKNETRTYRNIHAVYGAANKNLRLKRQKTFLDKLEQVQLEDAKRHNEELRKKELRKAESKTIQQKQLKRARQRFEDERTKRFKTQWVTSKVLEYEKMNRFQYGLPEDLNDETQYESKLKRRKSSLKSFKTAANRVKNMKKFSAMFAELSAPRWDPNAKPPKMDGIDTVELDTVVGSGKTVSKKVSVAQILSDAKATLAVPSKDTIDNGDSISISNTDLSHLDLDSLDIDDDGDEDEDIFERARKKYGLDLSDDDDDP